MTSTAKYLNLAQQIIKQIEQGKINQNTKLPSLRLFCQLHNISMTTALSCYRYLEQNGYAIAESKKGYFTQKPLSTAISIKFPVFKSQVATNSRNLVKTNTAHDYSLATAQLDEQLTDKALIKRCLIAATKQTKFALNYDDPMGNDNLRNQLAKHFANQGFSFTPNELVITHGCLDAILMALESITKSGDIIAVTSPCYSGLLDVLSILHRKVIEIPSTANGMDLTQLEEAMITHKVNACLITANHQNPTSHNLTNKQKQQLVELAEKYQTPIIEDDVFRELSHSMATPLPIKYFDTQGWVIWCSSVSKTLAPGLRVGWCLPGKFLHAFIQQRMVRTLGHNQPIQLALAEYIKRGFYHAHLNRVNRALKSHCNRYIEFLSEHLPKNAEISQPQGGLVIWIRIPTVNTEELADQLLTKGVQIKHGNLFSSTPLYQDCFRLNIGLNPCDLVYEQLATICALVKLTSARINEC